MKHLQKCETGKLCVFLIALLCAFGSTYGQDFQQERQKLINKLDLSGLKNTLILNAAITNQNESEYFKQRSKTEHPKPERVSAEEWQNLYERLLDADLRDASQKMASFNALTETDPNMVTRNDTVSIGVMNLSSIYFTVNEIQQNEDQKNSKKEVDFSTYDRFNIVYASVLQEDVYQADVEFRLNSLLFITNQIEKPDEIELDFSDGKGYTKYANSDKTIPHHFESIGEHPILIRFKLNGKIWVFETKINVRQLERLKPYKEFQVLAPRISNDTTSIDKSARTMLVGGNIRIILGCDQILNKPIIVAEGFDMGQDVTLDKIEANYRAPLGQYLIEGYDLVLLDYTDARAAIEDNAQVLKALIQQVNQMKTGNDQLVVIGESMSGLVARWALRQMENEAIAHRVRLMICYDTPHQGANVPVGLTQLLWEAKPSLLTQVILKFFAKGWRDYYQALGTPAGTQLLMHWGGQLTGGVGSKAPAFDIFRAQLLALGNGGYPQDCRNIAIIHGSMNAGDRTIFNSYNYGSRILRSWTPFGLQNTNLDVHTNELNQNGNVFRFATWGIFSKALGVSRNYTSSLNDDFLPGGRSAFPIPNKLFKETSSFDFCFVPTYSSIDFQGSRATQTERELINVSNINILQTPFASVYGGTTPNQNTLHVRTERINWPAIGFAENLLTFTAACPALPIPPTPTISNYNTCYPFRKKRTTEDNTANITVSLASPSNGLYIHNWTVLPSQQAFTTTTDQITFQAEHSGPYQIICVRTYPNRRDLQSTFTVTMMVDDCEDVTAGPENPNPNLVGDIDVTDIWEDDFLLTTAADSLAVFAHYTPEPEVLYATLQNGTFVSRAVLQASGMFAEFAALFAETDPRGALPVTLIAFDVQRERRSGSQANALLIWRTASELHSDRFEIERSYTGADWVKIGSVPAKNTVGEQAEYIYNDLTITSKLVYYRLKMLDSDGSFAYSRMQALTADDDQEISVFPNPVDSATPLQLLVGDSQVSHIRVFNLTGKLVAESALPDNLSIEKLPPGKYVVLVRLNDGSEISRAFVKR